MPARCQGRLDWRDRSSRAVDIDLFAAAARPRGAGSVVLCDPEDVESIIRTVLTPPYY